MFGDEDAALICLRNQHGWNILVKGDNARCEINEERGCPLMPVPTYGACIYAQCKCKWLGAFQRVARSGFCFKKFTWDTLKNGDCWRVKSRNRDLRDDDDDSRVGEDASWAGRREYPERLLWERSSAVSEVRVQNLSYSGACGRMEQGTWGGLLCYMWHCVLQVRAHLLPTPLQWAVSALPVLTASKRNPVAAWTVCEVLIHRMLYWKEKEKIKTT